MAKAKLTPPSQRPPAGFVLVTEFTESLLRGLYTADLSPEQHKRFLQIADRCPVHRTLSAEIRIDTRFQHKD